MRLAVISNVRVTGGPGAKNRLWYLAALQALSAGHEVTAVIHPDIAGFQDRWASLSARAAGSASAPAQDRPPSNRSRISSSRTFHLRFLTLRFHPGLAWIPPVTLLCTRPASGLLRTRRRTSFCSCQFNAGHLPIARRNGTTVARPPPPLRQLRISSHAAISEEARRQWAMDLPQARVVGIRSGNPRGAHGMAECRFRRPFCLCGQAWRRRGRGRTCCWTSEPNPAGRRATGI